jgi:hypothetical protein
MADKSPLPPGNVPGSSGVDKTKGFEKESPIKPSGEEFQSYMKEAPPGKGEEAAGSQQISPMELAGKSNVPKGGPTPESILGQVNNTQNNLNTIQNNLSNTPNLKLSHAQSRLLDNKLTSAQTYLNSASEKLGANVVPGKKVPSGSSPIVKFLSYVTNGQNQLLETKKKLEEISATKGQLSPNQLMLVQVKLTSAQQQIDYASALLAKVIDVIKTTMNIQI